MTDTCIDIVALAQQTAPTGTLMTVTAFDASRLSKQIRSTLGGGTFVSIPASGVTLDGCIYITQPASSPYCWMRVLDADSVLNPEMFGAVGDGIANDYPALKSLFRYASAIATAQTPQKMVFKGRYRLADIDANTPFAPLDAPGFCAISGGGQLYLDSDKTTLTMLTFVNKTDFSFSGLTLSRKGSDPTHLWSKQATALFIDGGQRFRLYDLDLFMHTDAISIRQSESFEVYRNKCHELGEEGIAVRGSRRWVLRENEIYHHNGDGILLKTSSTPSFDGKILNNRLYDAIGSPNTAQGHRGGGITLNDENGGSTTFFQNLLVQGNSLTNLSYGIAFTNIEDWEVADNFVDGVDRFGIIVDNELSNNPQKNPIRRSKCVGNTVRNSVQNGISFTTLTDIKVEYALIANNQVDTCGTSPMAEYPGISATGATVTGNRVLNCKIALSASGCATNGNFFEGSTFTNAGSGSNYIKLGSGGSFVGNRVTDTNQGHIRLSNPGNFVFADNIVQLNSSFAGLYFIGADYGPNTVIGKNVFDTAFVPVTKFEIGVGSIRRIQMDACAYGRREFRYDSQMPTDIDARVGDEVYNFRAVPGFARKYSCVTGGADPEWVGGDFVDLIVTSTAQDVTLAAGASLDIDAQLAAVQSTFVANGVKFNQNPKRVKSTVCVTEAGTVTFTLTNPTASTITLPALQLTTRCNSGA
ncbi:right-handed parallel beta-helix repeat-containing protein [Serratia proteamaculans]|uniref:right-handed parallel beta-helix repeat-containing protein n=1 Tax=Serratia proteamaculans TaxID=28151 RepID=UPI0039B0041A